ncbi:MAG: hypothetical protein QOJ29_1795 [Thermoleophilaceae bacterium]|jgi:hypothetical protein|nr:hypothetical protein [Thermoleophilaceae bacterium]
MTIRPNLAFAAIATIALAALAFAVVTATDSRAVDNPPASPPSAAPHPYTAFGVFRRSDRAGDAIPADTRRQLSSVADREGIDLDGARAVAPAGRGYVYAIPGPQNVCLAIPDPGDGYGVSCQDAAAAQNGKLWVGLTGLPGQQAGDVRVAILAPDGIEVVNAVNGAGERTAINVSDNVAFADLQDSASVEYFDGHAVHSVDVPGTPEQFVVKY